MMLSAKLQPGQYAAAADMRIWGDNQCQSTNTSVATVQTNLKRWSRGNTKLPVLSARAPACSSSFQSLPSPAARLRAPPPKPVPVVPVVTLAAQAPARSTPNACALLRTAQSIPASCRIKSQPNGGYSSVVELRTVAPAVVGSNPTTHPKLSGVQPGHMGYTTYRLHR